LQVINFVKGYTDVDGIAKQKGLGTYDTTFNVIDKSVDGRVETFGVRTQSQWQDWISKISNKPEKYTLQGK
jgi:hypothetical protein